jgi:hypothetical protein
VWLGISGGEASGVVVGVCASCLADELQKCDGVMGCDEVGSDVTSVRLNCSSRFFYINAVRYRLKGRVNTLDSSCIRHVRTCWFTSEAISLDAG